MPSDLALRVGKPVALRFRDLLGRGPRGEWIFSVVVALLSPFEPKVPLELRQKLALIRRGFLPVSYAIYRLDENDPSEYLTDRQREATQNLNGRAALLLGDKLAFAFMLAHLGAPTPAVEAVLIHGRLHPLTGTEQPWLRHRLDGEVPLVLKPATGGGGGRVLVLRRAGQDVTVNGKPTTWSELEARLAGLDDYIATTFVQQAEYAARIQPASTNSIRLLTMIDEDGSAFLASASHRFGSVRSMPVDNWAQGGLSVAIDAETGRLGPGALFPHSGEVVWKTHHPETGERIEGTLIPGWAGVRDGVLALAERLGFLPYVGWDVVVTDDGYAILEGNEYSGVGFQVHGGLLRDPRVRGFYRRHGVVP